MTELGRSAAPDEELIGSPKDSSRTTISLEAVVNGEEFCSAIPSNMLLLDFLHDHLGFHSVKRSCDVQMCGACTVLVNEVPVSSCCYLAASVHNSAVVTVEGLVASGDSTYAALEESFVANAAVQCGYCTPGFITTLWALINDGCAYCGY